LGLTGVNKTSDAATLRQNSGASWS